MSYIIVGLGNPGEEYENSRHNLGRMVLDYFRKKKGFSEWENKKKNKGLVAEGKIGKTKVILLEPETLMNKSGASIKTLVSNSKEIASSAIRRGGGKAENLVVVYDDLDLSLGTFKIAFNKGPGGHKGMESVIKSLSTKEFIRVRVGISQATPKGKLKKPVGEQKILDYLMGGFNKKDLEILKKLKPKLSQVLETIITDGRLKAMNLFN